MQQQETKLINAARELLKIYGYFMDNLWHVRDVHFICEQKNLARLSDEEAMEVFCLANEQFDGETGLSWPMLEKAVGLYLQRRTVLVTLCKKDQAL